MARPPCIVCGATRSPVRGLITHVAEIHDEYRKKFKQWTNLLIPRCPTLKGLPALSEFYSGSATVAGSAPKIEWGCKVMKNGDVIHVRVERKSDE